MWTNNCLGYNSIKPFILFNIYVCMLCVFGVTTIVNLLSAMDTTNSLVERIINFVTTYERLVSSEIFENLALVILLYSSASLFAFASTMIYTSVFNLKSN